MAHISLETFPQFDATALPQLFVLPINRPYLDRARTHPRLYLESRTAGAIRNGKAAERFVRSKLINKTIGTYSDIRPSMTYPRLTAMVEIEVVLTVATWRLKARARNGGQESIGGAFDFETYSEAFLHARAWIWYATSWIGDSWSTAPSSLDRKSAIEEVRSGNGPLPPFQTTTRPEYLDDDPAERFADRLFRLMTGEETISAEDELGDE